MKFLEIELPSNKKFGLFFACIFFCVSTYFHLEGIKTVAFTFVFLSSILLVVSLTKADLLLPFNKLWMRFGVLLGVLVSPAVLGLIFFGIFVPIAVVMRVSGRDELRLRLQKKNTHWVLRDEPIVATSFENQF